MAQTAQNEVVQIPTTSWTLLSEVNCTFVVESGAIELVGMDGAAPAADATGITYTRGQGEEASTDVLARFTGSGTADRIYVRAKVGGTALFVSRAAVA